MSDEKPIDLQKHVSPKVSRRYLVRFAIYAALVAGMLLLIYFLREEPKKESPTKNPDDVEEIRNFEIDTTS
ncbi:MAG: hypothetical protein DCO96_01125 [Fluviicola sp. XM-24bin1]|nr:MAG: hypothetical protein DCO96_01125 [Fluviicola sp. XM-24bin1]